MTYTCHYYCPFIGYETYHSTKKLDHFGLPHKLPTAHHPAPKPTVQSESTEQGSIATVCSNTPVDCKPLVTSDDSDIDIPPLNKVHSSDKSKLPSCSEQVQEGPSSNIASGSCDYKGGILSSINGDLKLTILNGAIKHGDIVTLSLESHLYRPFVLPSKRQVDVASPFYWIGVTPSYCFQQPVQVEFEHYGACDSSHYQLLCCEDDDESYIMRPVDYEFSFKMQDDMSWCSFEAYRFCSICLFHNSVDPAINRIAAICLKTKNFQYLNHFTTEIWFSFPISHCLKRNEELYNKEGMILDYKCSHTFEASCDKNSTSWFALSYYQDVDGWHMEHSRSKKINTKEINFYNYYKDMEQLKANENNSLFPQRFVVNVKKSESNTGLDTNIMVTLHNSEGEKLDPIPFKLCVPIVSATNTTKQTKLICLISNHKCDENKPELKELVRYSSSISTCWRDIALNFNISQDKISMIEANHPTDTKRKCYEMFETWLQLNTSPCWCDFIQALHIVGRNDIAEHITTTHLKQPSESSTFTDNVTQNEDDVNIQIQGPSYFWIRCSIL